MIRKNTAYTLQNRSKNNHGITLKRSHAYELIAAYFGYSSQAAMDAAGFTFSNRYLSLYDAYRDDMQDIDPSTSCIGRSLQLGYSMPEAEIYAQGIERIIQRLDLSFSTYENFAYELWDDDVNVDNLDKDSIEELESLALKQPGALYILACFNKVDPPNHGDSYWFTKRKNGVSLTPNQTRFADEYEHQLNRFNQYRSMLLNAVSKGHGLAAFDLAELGGDDADQYYLQSAELGCTEAQEYLGLSRGKTEWIVRAAERGSRDCLEELARSASVLRDKSSIFDAHKWTALAAHYGFNLTQSVADNDEDYGPVYVMYEGIYLPSIEPKMEAKAQAEALKIFKQHSA